MQDKKVHSIFLINYFLFFQRFEYFD
jgi:hypothetical protein